MIFMSDEYGVTEKGFERKRFDDIISDIRERIRSRIGEDVYLEKESPLRHILNSISFEIARQWDVAEHMYSSGYIDQASGKNLENIVALAGVSRQPATRSTGTVTFEGEAGTSIPEGTGVKTEDDIFFETTEEVDIEADGTVDASIRSVDRGEETNVSQYTITEFASPISGVYDVYNEEPTSGGQDKERDKELRLRTKRILEERGNATKNAIKQRLLDMDGVTSVFISEHTDEVKLDITVGGLGDEFSEEDESELHEIMDGVRAYGVKYELFSPVGVEIQVGEDTNEVIIDVEEEYPDGAKEEIENEIYEHINSLDIGEDVLYAKLYDIIYNVGEWIYNVRNLTLGEKGGSINTNDVSIDEDYSEKAVIDEEDIHIDLQVK